MCRECLKEIRPARAVQCLLCGDRLPSAQLLMGDGCCANCRAYPPEFERAVSFSEYEGSLRGLIHLLKYEGVTPVAAPLGGMLAQAVGELLPGCRNATPLLVPVPLHHARRRSRGYNQAEMIARVAAKRLSSNTEIVCDALVRRRETISQVGLTREERIANVRDAFRVANRSRIQDRVLIVVDDVMTTGTTLSECARVLKAAGARQVWAATVARAFHGADFPAADTPGEEEEIEAAAAVSV